MRNKRRIQISKRLLWVSALGLLSLAGGYYLVRNIDWAIVGSISYWLIGLLLVVSILYLLLYVFSVWMLLRGMGHPSHFGRLYLVVTSSMSTNYVTPVKAGIPIRLWLYKSLLGIPISSGSASLVVESTLGLSVGVALSLLGVRSLLPPGNATIYLMALLVIIACACILPFLCPKSLIRFVGRLLPSKYVERIIDWTSRFLTSLRTVPKWTLIGVFLLYLVRLGVRAFCLYLVLLDMGASSSLFGLMVAQSISGLVGILSMLPTGIGAKDASLAMLIMQLGAPRDIALIAILIDRFLWTLVPLGLGIISANVLGVSGLMRKESGPESGEP